MSLVNILDNYSKEELEEIVKNSFSYAEILTKLGYKSKNGYNWRTLKKRLNYFNINTDHFRITDNKDFDESKIFIKDSPVSQNTLRRRVRQMPEKFPYKCAICGLEPEWNGEPLTLILDHKNGIKNYNDPENLRWVCPNCNQQLWTTGYNGVKKYNEYGDVIDKENTTDKIIKYNKCLMCGADTINPKFCPSCLKRVSNHDKPIKAIHFCYDHPDKWDYFDPDHKIHSYIEEKICK